MGEDRVRVNVEAFRHKSYGLNSQGHLCKTVTFGLQVLSKAATLCRTSGHSKPHLQVPSVSR